MKLGIEGKIIGIMFELEDEYTGYAEPYFLHLNEQWVHEVDLSDHEQLLPPLINAVSDVLRTAPSGCKSSLLSRRWLVGNKCYQIGDYAVLDDKTQLSRFDAERIRRFKRLSLNALYLQLGSRVATEVLEEEDFKGMYSGNVIPFRNLTKQQ